MLKTKRLLIALIVAVTASFCSNNLSAREKTFGVGTGYVSHNKSALASLQFTYALSSLVRISPEVDCVFRNHNEDAYLFDVNIDLTKRVGSRLIVYPTVGFNYSSWNWHVKEAGGSDVELNTTNSSRRHMGLNAGAGISYDATDHLRLGCRALYTFVRKTPTVRVGVSISYVF